MWTPRTYRFATVAATPLIPLVLAWRVRRGKEDPARRGERLGRTSLARPAGPLVWVNAVSLGEAASALPLVERLLADRPALSALLTTTTVTSARFVDARLPARTVHQFAPVDTPAAVARFLDRWRPDAGLFVEAELWPNLVLSARARGVPLALVNARMTERTFRTWRRRNALIAPVLESFATILARGDEDAARFAELGAAGVRVEGDLKFAAPELAADGDAVEALHRATGDRPAWLAVSTHEGEEAIAARVHRRLKRTRPDLLTVIAPRHPERADAIARALAADGLAVSRRSRGDAIAPGTDVYLADTIGELGLLYRVFPVVFVGGSLVPVGGHNLLEPARLGATLMHGPHMTNFAAIARAFHKAHAAIEVRDGDGLTLTVQQLLAEPSHAAARGRAAMRAAAAEADVLDRVAAALDPLLEDAFGKEAGHARA